MGLWLGMDPLEWAILLLTIALVWMAEFFNTAPGSGGGSGLARSAPAGQSGQGCGCCCGAHQRIGRRAHRLADSRAPAVGESAHAFLTGTQLDQGP